MSTQTPEHAGGGPAGRFALRDEASRILAGTRDYRQALGQLARAAVLGLADWCVFECVEDDALVRTAVAHHDPEKSRAASGLPARRPVPPKSARGAGRAVDTRRADVVSPASAADLAGDGAPAELVALLEELGVGAYVSVPLVAHSHAFGAITFVSASPREFAAEDVALAEDLGRQAGAAIETARLVEAEQRSRSAVETLADRTARLYEVTAALSGALTAQRVAEVIVLQGTAALEAAAGLVALITPEGDALEITAALGYPAPQLAAWRQFALETRLPLADVARTGQPLFLSSVEAFGARYPHLAQQAAQSAYKAWAALPLLAHGRPIGALGLSFSRPRQFHLRDREFIHALVDQCALALERARLFEAERRARGEAEEANARLALLAEAGSLLAASLDYEHTLESVARLAVSNLADWCVVYVVGDDLSIRSIVVAHRDPAAEEWARRNEQLYPFDGDAPTGPANVIRTGQPELVAEISEEMLEARARDAAHLEALRHAAPRSYMGVPLKVHDRVLGALAFVSSTPGRYGAADLALAEELGRRAATAIENAALYQEAREARRIGEEVLAMASHDLKSPLSAIVLNAQLLEVAPAEGVTRAAEAIQRSAERMKRLIRDLLEMARIKGGRLSLERHPHDSDALVGEVVEMLRPVAEQKEHRIEVAVSPESGRVSCDRERVVQILSNILENAVRFTPAGGSIAVRVERTGHEVQFAVTDSGPGIPGEDLPHIFDRYWQSAATQRKGGLGLFIAKELVRAHDGRIWAESVLGTGSTFYFTLPALAAAEEARVLADA